MRKDTNSQSSFLSRYAMILILVAMFVVFSLLVTNFCSATNIKSILINNAAAGILALGCMFILVVGEFDLSLGYVLCLSMCCCAYAGERGAGFPVIILVACGVGLLSGLINGLLTVRLGISSFIVTLSLGLTLSGVAKVITGGGNITFVQEELFAFTRNTVGGVVGYCVIFWLIASILIHFIFSSTPFGRHMYAIGISPKAAYMAGVNASAVRIAAFTLAGLFAGLGGMVMVGQLGLAASNYGTSLLLPAYSVVFLSRTAIKPGYINLPGVLISMLVIAVGTTGIQMLGAPTWGDYMFEGAVLIFSMWISTRFTAQGMSTSVN